MSLLETTIPLELVRLPVESVGIGGLVRDLLPDTDDADVDEEGEGQPKDGPVVRDPKEPPRKVPRSKCLDFDMQGQTQTDWCWLATTTSVQLFYQPSSGQTQCNLANTMLNRNSCCQQPGNCNQGGDTEAALKRVGHFQAFQDGAATYRRVQEEIVDSHPVVPRIQWGTSNVFHAIAISGYTIDNDNRRYVVVEDPGGPETSMYVYETFKTQYRGNGKCVRTRFTQ